MNTDKLVHMVNQISEFFASYPAAEAEEGIRDHIVAFWTPRMVDALYERAAADPAALAPLVAAALTHPRHAKNPAEKTIAGPKELGALASDAG